MPGHSHSHLTQRPDRALHHAPRRVFGVECQPRGEYRRARAQFGNRPVTHHYPDVLDITGAMEFPDKCPGLGQLAALEVKAQRRLFGQEVRTDAEFASPFLQPLSRFGGGTFSLGASLPDASVTRLAAEGGLYAPKGPAGSVTIFDCCMAHASGQNLSPQPRNLIYLSYNPVTNAIRTPTRPTHFASQDFTPLSAAPRAALLGARSVA